MLGTLISLLALEYIPRGPFVDLYSSRLSFAFAILLRAVANVPPSVMAYGVPSLWRWFSATGMPEHMLLARPENRNGFPTQLDTAKSVRDEHEKTQLLLVR